MVLAVDYGQGVSDAWSTVATFIPKLVAFLVILLIGWLVAKAVEKILDKVLERVGFDRWVERAAPVLVVSCGASLTGVTCTVRVAVGVVVAPLPSVTANSIVRSAPVGSSLIERNVTARSAAALSAAS